MKQMTTQEHEEFMRVAVIAITLQLDMIRRQTAPITELELQAAITPEMLAEAAGLEIPRRQPRVRPDRRVG